MAPAASTSSWVWVPEHSLYYNNSTRVWAKVRPDGTWDYSDAAGQQTTRQPHSEQLTEEQDGATLEDGEDVDGTPLDIPIPEDQLWPDEREVEDGDDDPAGAPLLRLVVLESAVVKKGSVAILHPSDTVTIGRDRSYDKRVRLKELPVSKTHSTVFYLQRGIDGDDTTRDGCWAISDCGSTHGTYVKRGDDKKPVRLSQPKVASSPAELRHLDSITVGTTIFLVHIHLSLACDECASAADSSNLISLDNSSETPSTSASKSSNTPHVPSPTYTTRTKADKERERKEKMRGLREQFLQPGARPERKVDTLPSTVKETSSSSPAFVDRAALRRQRTGAPANPATSMTLSAPSPFFTVPGRPSTTTTNGPSPVAAFSAPTPPVNPFESTSRGAVLLSKLTKPGTTDDTATTGLGTLIQPKTVGAGREERPGLGSRPLVDIVREDRAGNGNTSSTHGASEKRGWREDVREASRKRYKEMQSG
ncbi:Forkhead-associated (FHA) domain containing protein [Pseudohyphozyma bogoriensis]|nr:Forkhead-associated (FHA) domain containing protein [Pseudohyphozyma bogoriensis]